MLEHFGTVESEIVNDFFDVTDQDDPDVMALHGVENGNRSCMMKVKSNIPSFCLLDDNTSVSIRYSGQLPTCSNCHQTSRGCRGNAKAKLCRENNGVKIPLKDFWKLLMVRDDANAREGINENDEFVMGDYVSIDNISKEQNKEEFILKVKEMAGIDLEKENMDWSEDGSRIKLFDLSINKVKKLVLDFSGSIVRGRTIYVSPVVHLPPEEDRNNDKQLESNEREETSDSEEIIHISENPSANPAEVSAEPNKTNNQSSAMLPPSTSDRVTRKDAKAKLNAHDKTQPSRSLSRKSTDSNLRSSQSKQK